MKNNITTLKELKSQAKVKSMNVYEDFIIELNGIHFEKGIQLRPNGHWAILHKNNNVVKKYKDDKEFINNEIIVQRALQYGKIFKNNK